MLMILGILGFGLMGGRYGAHMATAFALIALGVGFMVRAKACEMECCRKCGKIIGWVIMIISALLLVCLAVLCFMRVSGMGCGSKYLGKACDKFTHPAIEKKLQPTKK